MDLFVVELRGGEGGTGEGGELPDEFGVARVECGPSGSTQQHQGAGGAAGTGHRADQQRRVRYEVRRDQRIEPVPLPGVPWSGSGGFAVERLGEPGHGHDERPVRGPAGRCAVPIGVPDPVRPVLRHNRRQVDDQGQVGQVRHGQRGGGPHRLVAVQRQPEPAAGAGQEVGMPTLGQQGPAATVLVSDVAHVPGGPVAGQPVAEPASCRPWCSPRKVSVPPETAAARAGTGHPARSVPAARPGSSSLAIALTSTPSPSSSVVSTASVSPSRSSRTRSASTGEARREAPVPVSPVRPSSAGLPAEAPWRVLVTGAHWAPGVVAQ
ncbi:hypothetical protein [Micromonospora sp. LOL_024]|uniref:hypothetical protein n=1 Tax=Micromonospora sp. LOL_024 TaxID=3345412 RepID=UPI003A8933C9